MKNLLIATGIFAPEIGGPASYAKTFGVGLSNRIPVTVLTYSSVLWDKRDKKLPFRVVRVYRWFSFVKYTIYFLKAFFLIARHSHVLALNAVSAGVPALLAAKLFRKKCYVKIVGDYAWEVAINTKKSTYMINDFQKFKRPGRIGRLHWLQTWMCRHADGVIVPSRYLGGIVTGWGVLEQNISVVYNGTDFRPLDISREEARKKIGIPGTIILSVGRMVSWKGFRMLVKIMPKLLEVNQFFRLVIVGEGPELKTLKKMVRNLGLNRKVFLVGRKSRAELAVYLASADLFVLNTGYEGFSHQILEAMAAGVPIITTAVGGNREVIEQGKNGLMVKYNDEQNLTEVIKTVWEMPELREQFALNGKETARRFSAKRMLEETISVIDA